jgi:hypothetical protein
VATCAADGYDDSGLPSCTEWGDDVDDWTDDLDELKDQLEASFSEAEYYADSDMPSDCEFSGVSDHHHALQRTKDHASHHAAFGFVEDLHSRIVDALHDMRPSGFPFHHFSAGKGTADFFASPKKSTK